MRKARRHAASPPGRVLAPRTSARSWRSGEVVTVKDFDARRGRRRHRHQQGQGLRRRHEAPRLRRRPPGPWLAQHRQPGSIGACGVPPRVFKGMRMAGRMGGQDRSPSAACRSSGRRRAQHPADQGRRPGRPHGIVIVRPAMSPLLITGARGHRIAASWSSPRSSRHQEIKPYLIHQVVAQLAARRGGNARPRPVPRCGAVAPSRSGRRAPAAPVRARPVRRVWVGGGVVHGPHPRGYAAANPKKMKACRTALKAPCPTRAQRSRHRVTLAGDGPSTKAAKDFLDKAPEGLQARPLLVVVDGARLRRGQVVPQPAGRPRAGRAGSWNTVRRDGRASLLIERACWDRLAAIGEPRAAAKEDGE